MENWIPYLILLILLIVVETKFGVVRVFVVGSHSSELACGDTPSPDCDAKVLSTSCSRR